MKRKRYAPMVFAFLGTIAMVFVENTAFAYRGYRGDILLVGLRSRVHGRMGDGRVRPPVHAVVLGASHNRGHFADQMGCSGLQKATRLLPKWIQSA